ncbi:MAG: DNA topoisomerase (ATP-hydrolyzing), partial [Candidatus Berkelbacteria bacterium]|nr:DNA topoisomerase (ATP-hydrolyzing) [Candidatus Berkelbacteria bacterium]
MTDIGKIQLVDISTEMKKSYLDYAMSVIVARALPDVRDGLKPVHRRILYAMHELNLTHNAKYSKSAKIVGEVMGKYHPHGDMPIYDSLVRLAQDFSMRYPLVDGQGNFGSMDGDPAAAMRYTEARLAAITAEMLYDLDKETVDKIQNFDATLDEPVYLPAKLPNLLLMGSEGIAVGMATKIPPHNLEEVINAIIFVLGKTNTSLTSSITVEELMEFIKGPDFPTGASIYDINEIKNVYATGRGRIIIRGKADIEDIGQGKSAIIITELPYQVNKALLVARIAELAKEKKIEGISDLRDESDRHGIRVVVELKRDSTPKKILNNLYKHTNLQTTFPANFVALVDGTPQTLNLKTILEEYIKHRYSVITKRSEFELRQAKARLHILEGLKIAVENIDAVIKTIKESKNQEEAKKNLMEKFKLSDIQATAILDMQLRRLAALERQKIEDEYAMIK